MDKPAYRVFEVTADVGIELEAPTPEALFAAAAGAFSDLMFDIATIEPKQKKALAAEAIDMPGLLVALLSELLFLFEVEGLMFSRFAVKHLTDTAVFVDAWGEPFDTERHSVKEAVKAVTYHRLQVEPQGDMWVARIVFDL